MEKTALVLENGRVFWGTALGKKGISMGQLVFTTGMVGYLETLTDPSYYGQLVVQSFPLMGNYGVIPEDFESEKCALFGYLTNACCDTPSNWRSKGSLSDYLEEQGIVGMAGLDTRAVTALIREAGVMNAVITPTPQTVDFAALKKFAVKDAVAHVSVQMPVSFFPQKSDFAAPVCHVALLDFGYKKNMLRSLLARGCQVTVLPHTTTAKEILATGCDGILLSNGPGDPADNPAAIETIRQLAGKKPIFGICLGHQLLALAMGADTYRLHYGHRGINQPVIPPNGGRGYITSQNHGYAVRLPKGDFCGSVLLINANDHTVEGLDYPSYQAFSVQFHPEACAGPQDTGFLFDEFLRRMGVTASEGRS